MSRRRCPNFSAQYTRCQHNIEPVADVVQSGHYARNTLRINDLGGQGKTHPCKWLIFFDLLDWLAALDDFRPWLIREAAAPDQTVEPETRH